MGLESLQNYVEQFPGSCFRSDSLSGGLLALSRPSSVIDGSCLLCLLGMLPWEEKGLLLLSPVQSGNVLSISSLKFTISFPLSCYRHLYFGHPPRACSVQLALSLEVASA